MTYKAKIHILHSSKKEFLSNGLFLTRDETGVLIFISMFEHKVWMSADRGTGEKAPEESWHGIVDAITSCIRINRPAEGHLRRGKKVGDVLTEHSPIK